MITQKYKELLNSLQTATELGRVKWQPTSLETKFELKLGDFRITVYLMKYDPLDMIFPDTILAEINFIDETGSIFDSIKTIDDKSEEYQVINHLHEAARRTALNIDNKIDKLQSMLNSIDTPRR